MMLREIWGNIPL